MTLLTRPSITPTNSRRAARLESWLPSQCQVCHAWPASPLCEDCITQFARSEPRCERCALPLAGGAKVCGACLREPPPMEACLCAVTYQWPWTECLARFKFRQDTGLAGTLASVLLRTEGVGAALAKADAVVPLPLSAQRLSERGYNQALLLAHRLTSKGVRADLLARTRHTAPQHAMTREQRLKSLLGAFTVDPSKYSELRGRRVVLIDDVMTTGATLRAAAGALREAGASHITALVVARTGD
ncbi:ComF family protein [Ottowia thiooxydans]|uniref:ComF family protein n=1 Tax=Ottowia thiooxydans TaxID=219182 RepID=UPI00068565FC|nr:ComF family protein [Ottowia thiooxydans]